MLTKCYRGACRDSMIISMYGKRHVTWISILTLPHGAAWPVSYYNCDTLNVSRSLIVIEGCGSLDWLGKLKEKRPVNNEISDSLISSDEDGRSCFRHSFNEFGLIGRLISVFVYMVVTVRATSFAVYVQCYRLTSFNAVLLFKAQ